MIRQDPKVLEINNCASCPYCIIGLKSCARWYGYDVLKENEEEILKEHWFNIKLRNDIYTTISFDCPFKEYKYKHQRSYDIYGKHYDLDAEEEVCNTDT